MESLNTAEMLKIATEIVNDISQRGIGCIEGEIILNLASDRLRSQRYCEMANNMPPDLM